MPTLLAIAAALVATTLLSATPALAQPVDSTACLAGSCLDGAGTYRYADGTRLAATFVAGRAEGEGTFTFPDGDLRTGTLAGGQNEGPGVHTYSDGAAWTGTWRRGYGVEGTLRDAAGRVLAEGVFPGYRAGERGFRCVSGTCTTGTGTGVWPDSARYVGGWRDGLRHGAGTTVGRGYIDSGTYAGGRLAGPGRREEDGTVYVGTFRAGMRDGDGTLTLADSSVYAGQFRDDAYHGRGRLVSGGTVYEGMFADDAASGSGVRTYADGTAYDGLFAAGRPDGAGTFRFASGATWAGRWADGLADGDGPYADAAGTPLYTAAFDEMWTPGTPADGTTAGCLRGDCVDGDGTFRWPDGALHTGGFVRGLRHGPGTHTNALGTGFEATFRDGLVDGRGRVTYVNGNAYDGSLTPDGRRTGQGRLRYADGATYDGAFADGDPGGAGVMTQPGGCHHTGTFATAAGRTEIVAGTYACPDGTAYRGGWRGGEPHGDGVGTFATGVSWTGRFEDGRGAGDGDWADAAGVVYARAPYTNTPRAGAASTLTSVPVLGRVRVTTESAPGRRGVSVSAGDPALGERLFPRRP